MMRLYLKNVFVVFIFLFVSFSFYGQSKDKVDPHKYFAYGWELLEAGEYDDCILLTQIAADQFKNFSAYENGRTYYFDCLTQIGEAYLRMGKPKEAQAKFQELVNIAPENNNMLMGILAVYFRLNKVNDAKLFFESAANSFKTRPTAAGPLYYYYALCLSAQNDFKNARFATQTSIENYRKTSKPVPDEVEKFFRTVSAKAK